MPVLKFAAPFRSAACLAFLQPVSVPSKTLSKSHYMPRMKSQTEICKKVKHSASLRSDVSFRSLQEQKRKLKDKRVKLLIGLSNMLCKLERMIV